MASGGQKETGDSLVKFRTLPLKPDNLHPRDVILVKDKLVITEPNSYKVHVYRRHDGMLLSLSNKLESRPHGMCCVNDTDLCVAMINGTITLMSVSDSGLISRRITFRLRPSFDQFYGLAAFGDKIVVSGVNDYMICWCTVSLQQKLRDLAEILEGDMTSLEVISIDADFPSGVVQLDSLYRVCVGEMTFMTRKDNMVYMSCHTFTSDDQGVYGFNLLNPSQLPYRYKCEGLAWPSGITVDNLGYLFLCVWHFHSIHHLTQKCELVTIYKEGIPPHPWAIFWDHGILYVTTSGKGSNVITMYRTHHEAHEDHVPVPVGSSTAATADVPTSAQKLGSTPNAALVSRFCSSAVIRTYITQQVSTYGRKLSPTDAMQTPALGSTPSTPSGIVQAPISGSAPSITTGSTPSQTSESATAEGMQTAASISTATPVMQSPRFTSTTYFMPVATSASTPSPTDDLMQVSTSDSESYQTFSSTTADDMQTSTSS